jgi:hypothetical protein
MIDPDSFLSLPLCGEVACCEQGEQRVGWGVNFFARDYYPTPALRADLRASFARLGPTRRRDKQDQADFA